MSYKLESMIWSRDTGQKIPCFDRCQLIITWMSNIRDVHVPVHCKPKLHMLGLEYGCHVVQLCRCCRYHRHAYVSKSKTSSHDSHKKNNSWDSAWRPKAAGIPLQLSYDSVITHYNSVTPGPGYLKPDYI